MSDRKLLVFGDDNGSCSLYAMTLEEYEEARAKCDEADDFDKAWDELIGSKEIKVDTWEVGYIPDYVVKLAEIYGFDVESN